MSTYALGSVISVRVWRRLGLAVAALSWFAVATHAADAPRAAAAPAQATTATAALLARGDYLTHKVAMCVECHSPRDERGNILSAEEFTGAPVLATAPYWRPDWATREPNIAGLRGFTDEQIVGLLMTGRAADRQPPKRPMPPFRMTREDAEAVVAYLRTK
jgi:mono/diheme cytochrome c family protein